MNIGIVGLGLIGGSLAKAFKYNTEHTVYGFDSNVSTLKLAKLVGAIDGELDDAALAECDFVFIALYPRATVDFIEQHASIFKKDAIVIDTAGVKRCICEPAFQAAEQHGFNFVGGHPMAGTQFSGFKYTKESMFDNACMILLPKLNEDIRVLEQIKQLLVQIGFSHITVTTPEEHDKIIAFTSQMAHVVSNAYVKSPMAKIHKGFSAGSYKDLTRVAKLNETMWAELFIENGDNLMSEIDCLINSLLQYRAAISSKNEEELKRLLKDGRERKENIDIDL